MKAPECDGTVFPHRVESSQGKSETEREREREIVWDCLYDYVWTNMEPPGKAQHWTPS